MQDLIIQDRLVGKTNSILLIAEVAQAHEGSVIRAHEYVDVVAEAGFDAIKYQTHIAEHESTLDEPFRLKGVVGDETRYSYWERMEFSEEEWLELAIHARDRGLVFLSSAFSVQAVRLLRKIGVPAWKVGSGEFGSADVLKAMADSHLPIILSTGMMDYDEIDMSVERLRKLNVPFALMQCTSSYPTRLEDVGLNVIEELRKRYGCPAGLSDHSGSVHPGLAAIYNGADLLEVHVKLDDDITGPDAAASLFPRDIKLLAEARDAYEIMKRSPVDKDRMAASMSSMRSIFTKSVATVQDLTAGTVLERWMLTAKKPGTGIPPEKIDTLIGKRLVRDVTQNRILRREDVET